MKDTVKRITIQAIDWEKIFAKHISEKRFVLNIQRTLKTQQWENKWPNLKNGPKTEQTPHQRRYTDGK